jgi:hypothetical protein
MGYSPDWQKQNYSKGNSTPRITQKGNIVRNELFHNAPSRLGLADGGDVTEEQLKKEGLAASNTEREARRQEMSGFDRVVDGFKAFGRRMKEGSIDDPNSEAYMKYGAGRGRMERGMAKDNTTKVDFESSDYSGRNMKSAPMTEDTSNMDVPHSSISDGKPRGVFDTPTMRYEPKAADVEVRPFKPEPEVKGKPLKERKSQRVESRKPVYRDDTEYKDMKPEGQRFPVNKDLMPETSQTFPLTEPESRKKKRK